MDNFYKNTNMLRSFIDTKILLRNFNNTLFYKEFELMYRYYVYNLYTITNYNIIQ